MNDWKIVETFSLSINERDITKFKWTILLKRWSNMSGLIKVREMTAYDIEGKNLSNFFLWIELLNHISTKVPIYLSAKELGIFYHDCTDIYYIKDIPG